MAKKKKHGGSRKGAGRKVSKDGPSKTVAASVPESLLNELEDYAEERGWNRSQAITEAIRCLIGKSSKKR